VTTPRDVARPAISCIRLARGARNTTQVREALIPFRAALTAWGRLTLSDSVPLPRLMLCHRLVMQAESALAHAIARQASSWR